MRTAALFFFAALFAFGAFAAAPKPEDWYTPESYEDAGNTANLYYGYDKKTGWLKEPVKLNKKGEIVVDGDLEDLISRDWAMKTAVEAIQVSLKNSAQIKTLGQTLNDLLVINGFKISRPDGGVYTVRFGNGSQSIKDVIRAAKDGEANATSDQRLPDDRTIEWHDFNEPIGGQTVLTKELAIKNSQNPVQDRIDWNGNCGFFVPYVKKGQNDTEYRLHWAEYGGWDATVFENEMRPEESGGDNFMSWLTLKDWANAAGSKCDYKMSELLTSTKAGMDDERATHYVLTRKLTDDSVALHYVPIGDVIGGLGNPPDGVSIEDHIEGNATNLAIKGWYVNAADEGVVLADLMTSEKAEGAQSEPTYHVLLRKLGGGGETNSIAYASLGDLHKMSWSTNWYDSVKDIAEDRAKAIVNWNTNWVYLAGEIAKSKEATERYVDNALNWSTNWFASTTAMNASQAEIKKYIDGQLDIITNALNAIESAKASVSSINNVKQYIDSVMDYQTNVIIATERAKTSGAIESTQKLVNDTFDILTNELAAIDKVVKDTGIETINTVKQYVDTKFDFETNVIVNTELAKLNGTVKSVSDFVNETYDILTNKLDAIHDVVRGSQAEAITTAVDYVNAELDFMTNLLIAVEYTKMAKEYAKVKDVNKVNYFVLDTLDMLTNELFKVKAYIKESTDDYTDNIRKYFSAKMDDEIARIREIEKVVYAKDTNDVWQSSIPNVTNVAQYTQSAMEYETSLVAALEQAKTNGSIRSTQEFVGETFELITNKLNCIHGFATNDVAVALGLTNVANYVKTAFELESAATVAAKSAETNGSIVSIHDFVDEAFELITNKLHGIHSITGNVELAGLTGITNTAAYVSAALEVETNVVVAAKLAETNGSIRSISELVDDTFVLVTNRLNGIHGIVASGEILDITNTAGYVDALMAIETNVVVATKLAESNGSIRTIHEFVGETYDILTNKLYAIHDAIDGWPEPGEDEIDLEITNVAKYVQREMDFSTNLVIMTDKYVPVEMSIWVTNMYENLQAINNWNVVSNFFFAYFGGLASSTEGGEGDVPKIDPKDDPYSGDYESTETKDAMLPVKNARNIVAITNTPLEMIKAERIFDFDVIDTNCINCAELGTSSNVYFLAQLRGFRNANASTGSKIPVKRKKELIQRPDAADYDLETTSGYGIDWMDYPDALLALSSNDVERVLKWLNDNNISNIFNVVVSNADILAAMSTNLFGHVRAETLLDHETIWTNGARQIEIKGYEHADPFTVPYIDWGEVTNIVDRGYWDYDIQPEEIIDPVTGETNTVWRTNKTWIADWQTEVTEDKIFKWLRMPIPDVDGMLQYGTPYNYSIEGHTIYEPDDNTKAHRLASIYGFNAAGDCAIPYKHDPTEEEEYFYSNQISRVMWTTKPEDASPTKNYELTMNGSRVAWTPSASAIRFVGNVASDGGVNEAVVGEGANTNTVTFASAADSNVKVDVQGDGNGNVTITIGVYYVTESNLNPSSGSSGL